jgi:hypothetical protein
VGIVDRWDIYRLAVVAVNGWSQSIMIANARSRGRYAGFHLAESMSKLLIIDDFYRRPSERQVPIVTFGDGSRQR